MMGAIFWLCCTVAVYWVSKRMYILFPKVYLTPLLVTPVVVIALVEAAGVPFESYNKGGAWLTGMMEPATIALAVILYKHLDVLRNHAYVIVASVSCGSVAAVVTSAGLAHLFGLHAELVSSLAPHSATTPIALAVTRMTGGIPSVTALATLMTGLLGILVGPLIIKWFHVQSPVSRGILLGTSAHSAGIRQAIEYSPVSGSIAVVSMILTAFITLCVAPWIIWWLR
ncbi:MULTISPECIES: LrgB family protein [Paenibacillus]|uniref:Murein hydrolase effector protein LrgB n=1 Tax=Paenibacillus naphthalenovorans TaxID=162209 RepID=A0A0U2WG75_9BACL|nr:MULTISPECIES: LrgB family protein [Paenibacillus]ALS25390.1 murein hydrolase effector protein LrgB [Paenibacillus naphthalenovorans]NTZ16223.1 CidB/LrgB family autolysis modulator [Paenibacillus sp. JMULE4]GCL74292.1 CidB/LrgB family autolysis modulator [Paenibacillus naphthalenovorans]